MFMWGTVRSLLAILVGLFASGGMVVGSTNEQTLSVASTWQLPGKPKAVRFALRPDGEHLALMRTNRDVEIWSTSSHEMLRKISVEGSGYILQYSPDGLWLALLTGGPLWMVPAAGGTNETRIGAPGEKVLRATFSRDGRRVLVLGQTSSYQVVRGRVVNVADGKPAGSFRSDPMGLGGLSGPPVVRPLTRNGNPNRPISSWVCALSPDGSEVAFGQQYLEVERWDVAQGRFRSFVRLSDGNGFSTAFNFSVLNYAPEGGRLVAVHNGEGNLTDVAIAEADGSWRMLVKGTPIGLKRLAITDAFFTPSGKEVVLIGEELQFLTGKMESLMMSLDAEALAPAVQFRDVATGAVTRRYAGAKGGYFSQGWVTADEKRLVLIESRYGRVPRNFMEWKTPRAAGGGAASLVIVPLE